MLKKIIDNAMPEPSEYQVAIITTPKGSVATSIAVLNQDGELGMSYPFSGKHVYRDANNDYWLDNDGEVLPFDIELLEVIKENG